MTQAAVQAIAQPTLALPSTSASSSSSSNFIQIGNTTHNLDHHTPMMVQYLKLKADYPYALLLYRMGDFYELFFDDAVIASEILDITLTRRGKDKVGNVIAMAGVPFHSADSYMARLIARGQTVVICEQVENKEDDNTVPTENKSTAKLMHREVVKTLTAGTLTDDALIAPNVTPAVVAIDLAINKQRGKPDTLTGIGISQLDLNAGTLRTQSLVVEADVRLTAPSFALMLTGESSGLTEGSDHDLYIDLDNDLDSNLAVGLHDDANKRSSPNRTDDTSNSTDNQSALTTLVNQLHTAVTRFAPSEIIISEGLDDAWQTPLKQWLETMLACPVICIASSDFHANNPKHASQTITKQFGLAHLDGLGIADDMLAQTTCASLIHYAQHTQQRHIPHITELVVERNDDYLQIDATSSRGLELFDSATPYGTTLLSVVNHCRTPMGKRLLLNQLKRPLRLKHSEAQTTLNLRLDAVAWFTRLPASACDSLQDILANICDIERITSRISLATAKPKDLRRLSDSIRSASMLASALTHMGLSVTDAGLLPLLFDNLPKQNLTSHHSSEPKASQTDELIQLAELVETAIVDEPPAHTREGGMIATGFDDEFDRLTHLHDNVQDTLDSMVREAQTTHNLPNLKIGYNKVSGFYFELPKAQAKQAPDVFIRRQTLKNSERFTTDVLKTLEVEFLDAKTEALAREKALYQKLLVTLAEQIHHLRRFSATVAQLDVLINWAVLAIELGWTRPTLDPTQSVIDVRGGRHAVVEAMGKMRPKNNGTSGSQSSNQPSKAGSTLFTERKPFVANDCLLGLPSHAQSDTVSDIHNRGERLLLITGPNMGGKSTYMRQTALIVLLACCGSFVPADSALIGDIDRIFTRIGSADDLAGGKSTFMVEMIETAQILNLATPHSLVLMDEVGRGTATTDGLAIATACVHKLCDIQALTLFATHYFELTELQSNLQGKLKNVHVATSEIDGQLLLLHRIEDGSASSSFGLHVARLAGLPNDVLKQAGHHLNAINQQNSLNSKRASHANASQRQNLAMIDAKSDTESKTQAYADLPSTYANYAHADNSKSTEMSDKLDTLMAQMAELDPDNLTPKEALNILYELKSKVLESR